MLACTQKTASGLFANFPMMCVGGEDTEGLEVLLQNVVGYDDDAVGISKDAFGNVVLASGTAAADNAYRFSTKYADDESGYSYYGYRYYDAELGRWTQRDLIEEQGGWNLYGFALNAPSNLLDARGLMSFPLQRDGKQVGIVDVPLYEKWGAGRMFTRPGYGVPMNESRLRRTITTDSRGAHIIAAPWVWDDDCKTLQWRQRVQITNQDGALVDIVDYDADGDGKADAGTVPITYNWELDRQSTAQEWYWDKRERAIAVQANAMYWKTRGKTVNDSRFPLFEDTPNQPVRLLAKCGPFGLFCEPPTHPLTGLQLIAVSTHDSAAK